MLPPLTLERERSWACSSSRSLQHCCVADTFRCASVSTATCLFFCDQEKKQFGSLPMAASDRDEDIMQGIMAGPYAQAALVAEDQRRRDPCTAWGMPERAVRWHTIQCTLRTVSCVLT